MCRNQNIDGISNYLRTLYDCFRFLARMREMVTAQAATIEERQAAVHPDTEIAKLLVDANKN